MKRPKKPNYRFGWNYNRKCFASDFCAANNLYTRDLEAYCDQVEKKVKDIAAISSLLEEKVRNIVAVDLNIWKLNPDMFRVFKSLKEDTNGQTEETNI